MPHLNITTGASTQVRTGKVYSTKIQINAALTGSIKVIDGTTGTTANVATITNPVVGNIYEYWSFQNGLRIVTSDTCDITVNYQSNAQPK